MNCMAQRERLVSMLGRFFDVGTVRAIMALARPAVRLSAAGGDGETLLRSSRLGGVPPLADGVPWPRWGERVLDFLGVIDFAEIAAILRAGLAGSAEAIGPAEHPADSERRVAVGSPERGVVNFFYAAGIPRPWGDDPAQAAGWRVISQVDPERARAREGGRAQRPAEPPPAEAPRKAPPRSRAGEWTAGQEPGRTREGVPELPLSGTAFLSLPGPLEPALLGISDVFGRFGHVYGEAYRAWVAHVWPGGRPRHQVGGWPVVVQRPLGADCARAVAGLPPDGESPNHEPVSEEMGEAAREWRLLLQLDSDDRLGWFWGDAGRVYFSIRERDADRGAFDRCWLTLQSR